MTSTCEAGTVLGRFGFAAEGDPLVTHDLKDLGVGEAATVVRAEGRHHVIGRYRDVELADRLADERGAARMDPRDVVRDLGPFLQHLTAAELRADAALTVGAVAT